MEGFVDRFDPDCYRNDPVVGILCDDAGVEAWIPERLYRRLYLLGRAYEMHYLGLVPGDSEPAFLNSIQARGLIDELEFLLGVVDDPLLSTSIGEILNVVTITARRRNEAVLRVEGE